MAGEMAGVAGENIANVEGNGFFATGSVFLETKEKIIKPSPAARTSAQNTVLEEILIMQQLYHKKRRPATRFGVISGHRKTYGLAMTRDDQRLREILQTKNRL
ncbi:MAG: hypothetical protein HY454_00035 [Parcubacteria group bacterium]|nr:hypothetical protein [Parcubacteria group bacterium]